MNLKNGYPIVSKVWGVEVIHVNEPEYCLKTLILNKGATCSLHYHPIKKETFIIQRGKVRMELNGETWIVDKHSPPITITTGSAHRFTGIKDSILLEISTHHDDKDVVRIEPSKGTE